MKKRTAKPVQKQTNSPWAAISLGTGLGGLLFILLFPPIGLILSIIAIFGGRKKASIDTQGIAKAGFIIGIIGTILNALFTIFMIVLIIVLIVGAISGAPTLVL